MRRRERDVRDNVGPGRPRFRRRRRAGGGRCGLRPRPGTPHTISMVAKLAVSTTLLLTVGLVVLIWFSMMGTKHYLRSGIDDDLNTSRAGIEQAGITGAQLSALAGASRLPDAIMTAGLHGTTFVMVDASGGAVPIGDRQPDALQRALAAAARGPEGMRGHSGPRDVELGGETYRVIAAQLADGNFVVLARETGEAGAVVHKVIRLEVIVGSVLVVLLGTFIYCGARWRLRPIEDMVETASGIAEGGPDRPNLSARVAPRKKSFREVEQLRTALNAMLQQVETAFETREHAAAHLKQFVADASHELRTPLAAIRGYLQLYEKDMLADDAERSRVLGRMSAESERMARLVDELLALARLDQRPQLRPRPVDLACVAREAAADLTAQQPDRRVDLDLPADGCVVLADEPTLRQIVGNLLANVRSHTPATADVYVSVHVDATAAAPTHNGDGAPADAAVRYAVLRVRDTGPGMRPADAERVFDRFFRAAHENQGRPEVAGSGLGMAVVRAAVSANNGRVRVDTAPGEGLTVTVELPAVPAEDGKPPTAPPARERPMAAALPAADPGTG